MNLEFNAFHLLAIYLAIIGINVLVKWLAGHLVGGSFDAIGRAILNLAP